MTITVDAPAPLASTLAYTADGGAPFTPVADGDVVSSVFSLAPLVAAGVQHMPPDLGWNGYVGDLVVTSAGQLQASDPIRTAVEMLLFTDARCAIEDLRFEHGGDRRGWAGDGFDLREPETPMGSTLWLLRRAALTDDTARRAADQAMRALEPLIEQGIAARVDTRAEAAKAEGMLKLFVDVVGLDGRTINATAYDLIWSPAR